MNYCRGIHTLEFKREFVITTDNRHKLPITQTLLDCNSTPESPNHMWRNDVTYIATDVGWLQLLFKAPAAPSDVTAPPACPPLTAQSRRAVATTVA
jgi:hypothetical protein